MNKYIPSVLPKTMLVAAALSLSSAAFAAVLHPDVSRVTYHDFGQNYGRYSVQNVNALLDDLSSKEIDGIASSGGVYVHYLSERAPWKMPHGMISYHGISQTGNVTAINPAFVVTVEHNPTLDAEFTSRDIGGTGNCIRYYSIEHDESNKFELWPGHDYKIMRTSKLITDVDYYSVYTGELSDLSSSTLFYRAGAGSTFQADHKGNIVSISGALTTGGVFYATAGIDNKFINYYEPDWSKIDDGDFPLPMDTRKGDSGSPVFVWNEEANRYEYISSVWAMQYFPDGRVRQSTAHAVQWTNTTMEKYNIHVDLSGAASNEIHLGAINIEGETVTDQLGNSGTAYTGLIKDGAGETIGTMAGVKSGLSTWASLSGLKDTNNWYNYGDDKLNDSVDGTKYADLILTKNLVLTAENASPYEINVEADIDLGLGYLEFRKGEQANAKFTITSDSGKQLNAAGYVVGGGVDLYIDITNTDSNHMREWRKIGEGNLHLTGTGNNQIFLNVGGEGTSYLKQQDGYAAYNVLANNGATVQLAANRGSNEGIGQIYRDFTFGAGGGVLDMNGNSMVWNNSNAASAEGFTIQALTQDAVITNTSGDTTLTVTHGTQTFKGSFVDTTDASLKIVYNGGSGKTWTLNSIHTDLRNHKDSGLVVQSGTVALKGTNTLHAPGSLASGGRYSNADDWHYADSSMNVTVESAATFELGSHARLTGDITVKSGGNYIMREGVKHQYEYIEGWYDKEDTYKIADYYGHKGDVSLEETATMTVKYNEGVTANTSYAGEISGAGNVVIDAGILGGTITFTGKNSFSGTKTVESGGLIATTNQSLGNVGSKKWLVEAQGFISSGEFTADKQDSILDYIDANSSGVVALQAKEGVGAFEQLELGNHKSVIIGALKGQTVQYGTFGTDEVLKAYDSDNDGVSEWNLGGGGGTLVVNYALSGNEGKNILNLGNEYTHGTVKLTNTNNQISLINFNGAVTLDFDDDAALGGASLNLNYGVRVFSSPDVVTMLKNSITADAGGVLLMDNISDKTSAATINLSTRPNLALGADGDVTYEGQISVATDGTYYLGGTTGVLNLTQALAANGTNNIVVDGHTYSGGVVKLGAASEITGTVTVQGYDVDKLTALGKTASGNENITLSFSTDDALKNASYVYVKNGGTIDLNGTSQTFNYLDVTAGNTVFDSNQEQESTLTVNLEQGYTLNGTIDVDNLEKTGAGRWTINGHLEYDKFTINEGTVFLNVNDALSSTGIVYVEGGTVDVKKSTHFTDQNVIGTGANFYIKATGVVNLYTQSPVYQSNYSGAVTFYGGGQLKMAGANVTGNIVFDSDSDTTGGTLYMGSTTGSSTATPVTISGPITVLKGIGNLDTMKTNNSKHQVTLTGEIVVYHGATLTFKKTAGETTYNISIASVNNFVQSDENGNVLAPGTLDVYSNTLNLSGSNQTVGGTLRLNGGVTLTGASGTKNIDNLEISATANVNGGATWKIHSLTGNGTRVNMWGSGNAILDGAGTYTGIVSKNTGKLEIAHQGAVENAQVEIQGTTTFAINADSANMRVLSGESTATMLAGSASDTTSVRRATLTLSGGADADFAGTVVGDSTNALSIVKNGTGKQTFSGDVTLHDIAVNNGTLELSGTASVLGNMSIAQGSTLAISGGYSLDKGKTLSIVAGSDKTLAANLGTALTINGGTLAVDGAALQGANTKALDVDSVTIAEGATMNIAIGSLASVESGTSYVISSGNWTALSEDAITTLGLQYMNYTYDCSEDGLKVTFTTKDGTQIWAGTESENSWNNSKFGSADALPTSIAIFNDLAENKNVNLTATPSVEKIYFDNSEGDANTYTISGSAYIGGVSEIAKAGSGTAIIDVSVLAGSAALNLYDGTLKLTEKASAMLGTIKAYGDATLLNDSTVYAGVLEAENGATLNLQGGTLTFSGSEMNASGGTIVMDKVAWVTSAEALAVKGTLKIVGESSWSGNEKTATIAEEAKLILNDKATLVRVDEGDTIIAGTLLAEAGSEETGASAVFESAGNLLLDSGASIAVGENASLRIDTSVKQKENASATIRLDEGAVLTIRDGVRLDNSSVNMSASDNELWLNADSTIGTLDLNGTSVIGTNNADGADVTVTTLNMTNGARAAFEGVNLTVSTGATRFRNAASANHTIALADNAVLDDRKSYYAITGTLNVLGGEDSGGILYIDGIRLSDAENVQSYLNVGENAHVVITGEDSGQTGDFALSHWGNRLRVANKHNIVSVHGQLTSNAVLSAHDTYATINVHKGGELNLLKGLARSTTSGHTFNMFVDVLDGGTLNAAGGTEHENLKINLNSGATLGGIASSEGGTATFSNAMTVGTANTSGTVTIDTDVKTVSDFLLNDTTGKGGTIALTGAITSASDLHTSLELVGSGTLALSGTVNVDEIKLSGAHLSVDGDGVAADVITISLSSAYAEVNGSSAITGTGTLAAGTTISVDGDLSAMGLTARTAQAAYSYKLWESDDLLNETVVTLNDSFKTLLASLSWKWNEDFAETGVLTLTIPEPSMFGFLAGLSALALVSSRRRRKIR